MKPSSQPVLHAALVDPKCPIEIVDFLVLQAGLRKQIWLTGVDGNLPLHLACNRNPQDARSLRDARSPRRAELIHYRNVLNELLAEYPSAALKRNDEHMLPLTLMHRAGHKWNEMLFVLAKYPSAVLDLGLNAFTFSHLVARLSKSDTNAFYQLIQGSPFLFLR
jgi:hypothetical protein